MNVRQLAPAALLVAVLPFVPSCGGGLDVDFWDEREFDVNVPAGSPATIDDSKIVDLAEHAELKDKLSQLKSVSVPEIWLEVSAVDATNLATSASGKLEVSAAEDGAVKTLVGDYTGLAIGDGGKTKLTLTAEAQAAVQKLAFTAPNKFKAFYTGSLDHVPAKFHLKARIHIVATVGL